MRKKLFKKAAVAAMTVMMIGSALTVHAEDGVYTVKRGDNLSKIAKEVYGSREEWKTIYEANKGIIKNANTLYAGQQLVLPGKSSQTTADTSTETSTDTTTDTSSETTADTTTADKNEKHPVRALHYWNGEADEQIVYSYDSQGNKIKETMYSPSGDELYYWKDYSYDSQGNLIKETECSMDGTPNNAVEYSYDSQGNLIKETSYDQNGNPDGWWKEYSYDSQGNQVKETQYDPESLYWWAEYGYDSQGNQVKRTVYGADGSMSYVEEYSYDSQGNLIKETQYDANGVMSDMQEYSYDSQGNLMKETYWAYSDGNTTNSIEYIYE